MQPRISVIIPLYNKENTIAKAIQSIISQNYIDWELIIVDDGSSDKSAEMVKSFLQDERIRYFSKENGGPSSARNYGIDKAIGKWILFLDADDYFLPNAFSIYMELIQNNSDIKFFTCNFYIEKFEEKMLYSYKYRNGIVKNNFRAWLFNRCMPRTGACIIDKHICKKYSYNEKLRRYEDADILFKTMAKYRIYRCKAPVMVYNQNTLEASHGRKDINEDYVSCLDLDNGSFWERMVKYNLLFGNLKLYPQELSLLYKDYLKRKHIYYFLKICHFINGGENRIYKLLRRK